MLVEDYISLCAILPSYGECFLEMWKHQKAFLGEVSVDQFFVHAVRHPKKESKSALNGASQRSLARF